MDQLVALVLDEGKWLTISMTTAFLAAWYCLHSWGGHLSSRRRVLATMNLVFALTIGVMAFGHLLAVTIKLALGTLAGSLLAFYAIGAALAVPSWWLAAHAFRLFTPIVTEGTTTLCLNVWLSVTLLLLGLHNFPLAAPALFNVCYQQHSRRLVGAAIVGAAVVVNIGLFIGSLVFFASGQTFEQFRGVN